MLDRRSRITVVGGGRRVDVALPSESPIGEYVVDLAEVCGQASNGVLAPVWTLAPAGGQPWPVEASLAEAGVADGEVLYLRDNAHDPGMAPVVEDIEELVAADARQHRETTDRRGVLTVWLGTGWLTLAAAAVALRPHGAGLLAAVGLVLVAIVMLALAWALNQKHARLPATACLAVSLCAAPCLAAAGGLLGQALDGRLFWCGVVLGATVGTAMALAATPEPAILAAEVPLAVASVAAVVLVILHATAAQTAAAATVLALVLLAVARPLAGVVAAWSARMPAEAAGVAPATARLMLRARGLLALILTLPAVALVAALPVLALSGGGWALALAACAGVALVARARQVGFASEVVPLAIAGTIGLFAVVGAAAYRYLGMAAAIWALVLVGGVIAGIGTAVAALHRPTPTDDEPAQFASVLDTRDRGRIVEVIGMLCLVVSAALAMGVFGVFDELFGMGRTIVG